MPARKWKSLNHLASADVITVKLQIFDSSSAIQNIATTAEIESFHWIG
jgi:hypothetical protein